MSGVRKWKQVLLLLAVLLLSTMLCAQETRFAGPLKVWHFQWQHGEASIELTRGSGDHLVLGVLGPPCEPCASVEEESHALANVMHDLPGMGLDPRQVSVIVVAVDDPEVRKRVAAAALRSKSWLACSRTPACAANQTLVNLLNEIGAFAPFGAVVREYGLSVHVGSAEKVTVVRARAVEGLVVPAGTSGATKVPVNGQLEIRVERSSRP